MGSSANPYYERLTGLTDAELVRIVTVDVAEYNPESVLAARTLLTERGVSSSSESAIRLEVIESKTERIKNEEARLSTTGKVLSIIFPFVGFIYILLFMAIKGYRQKAIDYLIYSAIGIVMWIVLTSILSRL